MAERTRALITGASSGIGAAVARRLAQRHEVWLAARRRDRLEAEVAAIAAAGGTAHAVVLDVSRPDETAATVERLDAEIGGFDLVVANAGIGSGGVRTSALTLAAATQMLTTNTLGVFATLLPLLPRMIERAKGGRRGHIAAVSSLAAEIPVPAGADYGASKAAVSYFMTAAAGELPALGVDVTLIHPGFVKSELTEKNRYPMPFLLETDEAARLIDDALAARAQLVRFPRGLTLLIGLGKVMPRALKDAIVARNTR